MSQLTVDGKQIISGKFVFDLKAEKGLPLGFSLDQIINENGHAVSWIEFIQEAQKNGWRASKIYNEIKYGLEDAGIDRELRAQIIKRVKLYLGVDE